MSVSNVSGRRRSPLRRLVAGLGGLLLALLVLLVGAALLLQARIDPDALRRRIEQQCFEATGRTLTLGAVHLSLLPVPTLSATGLSLSGLPTDSRPQMLIASSASAHLALWPLIHHVARLDGVTLFDPDLRLERDAEGHANWRFIPPPKQPGTGPGSVPGRHWHVEINSLRLRDGALAWRDAVSGWSGAVSLDRLDGTGLSGDAPRIELSGRHGTAGFGAEIVAGSLFRLLDASDTTAQAAWPLNLSARTSRNGRQDAAVSVDGALADPARGRGFALDVVLDAPHPDGINSLFPHAAIPASGPVSLRARLVDAAAAGAAVSTPTVQRLDFDGRGIDLGALLRRPWSQGLLLAHLTLRADTGNAPVVVSGDGRWQGRPISVSGTAGTLEGWQQLGMAVRQHGAANDAAPSPFDLQLHAGDAAARLNGVADRDAVRATVQLTAPSLRALLPVGPALTGMSLQASVALSADRHLVIDALDLRARELALSGHASLSGGAHPAINAVLSSAHVDLDALRAGWVDPPPATVPAAGPASAPQDASQFPPASATPAQAPIAAAPATPPPPGEHGLPFARLRCCDASIRFTADALVADGLLFHAVSTTLALHGGVLSVSPLTATGPSGPIDLSLQADAGQQTASLQMRPSMLPAATLAGWLHRAPVLDGPVEAVADLTAAGATIDAMERDVHGHLGLSMVDGSIATEALAQVIGRPQAAIAGSSPGGRTGFRCLALPATLSAGVATLDPIALSTERLVVQGRGTVTLVDGRLDLHLTPHLAIGATAASLPVRIGGTLDAPEAALDPAAPGGRFSLSIGGAAPADPCAAALNAARFGAPGPMPGAAKADNKRKLPKPLDILRGLGLFR